MSFTLHYCGRRKKNFDGKTPCGIQGQLINPFLGVWPNPMSGKAMVTGQKKYVDCEDCKKHIIIIPENIRVWKLNEYEWWCGTDYDETVNYAAQHSGEKPEDYLDDAHEIERKKWKRYKFFDADENRSRSMKFYVEEMIKNKETLPFLIAVTE